MNVNDLLYKTFQQTHVSLAVNSRKVIFLGIFQFPVEIPSLFPLLYPALPWEPGLCVWTGSMAFLPSGFPLGSASGRPWQDTCRWEDSTAWVLLAYPSLDMDQPQFLSVWPGNPLHAALSQGSGNCLHSPCFRLRGGNCIIPYGFSKPFPVLWKSSLVNSPGLLSLVCHLLVARTLYVPRDVFEDLPSTVIIHFYSSKNIFPICSLLLLLQSLTELRFRALWFKSQLHCNVALGFALKPWAPICHL